MHHLLPVIIANTTLFLLLSRRYSGTTAYSLFCGLPLFCFSVASLDEHLRGIRQLNHQIFDVAYDTSYLLTLAGLILLLLNIKQKSRAVKLGLASVLSAVPLLQLILSGP